jgi:hypothetical protein
MCMVWNAGTRIRAKRAAELLFANARRQRAPVKNAQPQRERSIPQRPCIVDQSKLEKYESNYLECFPDISVGGPPD